MLTPAMTRASPSSATSASTLPMPFCSVSTKPSGLSTCAAVRAASLVALASVKMMTKSAGGQPGMAGLRRKADDVAAAHPLDRQSFAHDDADVVCAGVDQRDFVTRPRQQPAIHGSHRSCPDHVSTHASLRTCFYLQPRRQRRARQRRAGPAQRMICQEPVFRCTASPSRRNMR